ncbi:MAG: ABC transporter ATP-binding protein [Methanosarcinales archaeon]|nr:MAG: ABC transporter ATP-binding protein [Methanosarcinales archaeon]
MKKEVVRLENVWVHYNRVPILEEINLAIYQHDFLGIIGPNGGGKSTLLKVILGLIKPDKGEIKVFGHPPEKSRERIGYLSQYKAFDRDFPISVWDVVLMARMGLYKMFKRYSEKDKKSAESALKTVEMLNYRDRQIGTLSGGQQQRVLIARALVSNPELLLLDEPTAGIDVSAQREFYELLKKLNEKTTIVLVSHDLTAVSVYVDKIACLNRRLFYHNSKEIRSEDIEAIYQCPVELIAHGVPHRVLKEH